MTKEEFTALAAKGPILLDGATGSNLMKAGMPKGVCTEDWILKNPEVLIRLQKSYAAAGSQIIYAPTFGANRISLEEHDLASRVKEMNRELVALTKEVQKEYPSILIAGDVTTTGKPIGYEEKYSYENLFSAYQEQILALAEAGVDLIVAETLLSVDEAILIMDAASSVCDLPVMCTVTVSADGTCYFGGTAMELVISVQAMGAVAAGINCSLGPDQMEAVVKNMAAVAQIPVIAKPNAGMPTIDDKGQAHYHMDAYEFAVQMNTLNRAGASVLGGCCGTAPDYIEAMHTIF